jgi:hypothetical protein
VQQSPPSPALAGRDGEGVVTKMGACVPPPCPSPARGRGNDVALAFAGAAHILLLLRSKRFACAQSGAMSLAADLTNI